VNDAPGQYTFWDYQAGACRRTGDCGSITCVLSPQASDRLVGVGIDSYVPRLGRSRQIMCRSGRIWIWKRPETNRACAGPRPHRITDDQSLRPCTQCSSICSADARSSSDAFAIALL